MLAHKMVCYYFYCCYSGPHGEIKAQLLFTWVVGGRELEGGVRRQFVSGSRCSRMQFPSEVGEGKVNVLI